MASAAVGRGQDHDLFLMQVELCDQVLEVVAGGDLALGLFDRVHPLLSVKVRDHVEGVLGAGHGLKPSG
jgi:hypothetical protein